MHCGSKILALGNQPPFSTLRHMREFHYLLQVSKQGAGSNENPLNLNRKVQGDFLWVQEEGGQTQQQHL